ADAMRKGIAEVKRLYFQAVLARRDIDVATENRQMFQQLVQLNLARFQQGAIPEADLIKVRLERIKFDSALKQAELGFRQAMFRLAERLEDDALRSKMSPPAWIYRFLTQVLSRSWKSRFVNDRIYKLVYEKLPPQEREFFSKKPGPNQTSYLTPDSNVLARTTRSCLVSTYP